MKLPITIKEIERAHGLKAKDWAGKCYEMACRAADLLNAKGVEATAVYGHFMGEVHPASIFYGKPLVQHGWVELEGDLILDPTRWAFEGKKPYLYVGPRDTYDEGGNTWRMALLGQPPEFDPEGRIKTITTAMLPSEAWNWLEQLLGLQKLFAEEWYEPGQVTVEQLGYVANYDPHRMDGHAEDIYRMLGDLGLGAFIPIDNRMRVEQGRL